MPAARGRRIQCWRNSESAKPDLFPRREEAADGRIQVTYGEAFSAVRGV